MEAQKLVIGMVGLPARGKTYVAKKLCKYLSWLRIKTAVFNIGNYRRFFCGAGELKPDFFDPNNADGVRQRNQCAELALKDLVKFLGAGGEVAIYDGTNTNVQRRLFVRDYLHSHLDHHQLIWLEIICEDEQLVNTNIVKAKLSNPDFISKEQEVAILEFQQRIDNYKKIYEPLQQDQYEAISYIQYKNLGTQVNVVNVDGQLQRKIIGFILNMTLKTSPIYLIPPFEPSANSPPVGAEQQYNQLLRDYFLEEMLKENSFQIVKYYFTRLKHLDRQQLNKLLKDKMIQNFKEVRSEEEQKRAKRRRKLSEEEQRDASYLEFIDAFYDHRLPSAQSLVAGLRLMGFQTVQQDNLHDTLDVAKFEQMKKINIYQDPKRQQLNRDKLLEQQIQRVEPFIYEMERQDFPILIIASRNTLQQIYNYLIYEKPSVCSGKASLHDLQPGVVYKCIPDVYHCRVQKVRLDVHNNKVQHWTSAIISQTEQEIGDQ